MVKYILATKEETYDEEMGFCVSAKEKLLSFEEAKQTIIDSLERTLKRMESKESLYSLAIKTYIDDIKESIQCIKDCTEENFHSVCDNIAGNNRGSYYVPIMIEE